MKLCTKCKIYRADHDFYADKTRKDGLQSYCKICKLIRAQETYRPEKQHQKYERLKQHKEKYWIDADGYLVFGSLVTEYETVAKIPQHHVEPLSKIIHR